ncbi:J domain-containing protein [Massilia niastensis]|uniref:J domain-containing protein n=1 Tax=Massilia niastensis TaxID=544911 RepID=UPI00037DE226|nr:J domain-containing protein [Massilia niastensis]
MAKIHTHYDNLKVSRHAPQEVIRAAYKALSQKYHPDKNPGDEKAARIMAIVNTAYNTLSDPLRRKEHDEWIAAEEWEVEWLANSDTEEGREHNRPESWEARPLERPRRARLLRDPRWWLGLSACFVAGAACAVLLTQPPNVLPSALAWGGKPVPAPVQAPPAQVDEPGSDASTDGWARREGGGDAREAPPDIKALAVTQLVVPQHAPDCSTDLQTLTAPSGDPWPAESGYLPGYPVGNDGNEMQVLIDNSANASPVFVKLYDLDRRSNVRHAYVLPRARFTIDRLSAGKYEVRYQNIIIGAGKAECGNGYSAPLRQAAAASAG